MQGQWSGYLTASRVRSWLGVCSSTVLVSVAALSCDRPDLPTAPMHQSSTFQPRSIRVATLAPNADTYVRGGAPNQNHGADGIVRVQQSGTNRGLLRWDRQSVAQAVGSDSVVTATIQLTIVTNGSNWGTLGNRTIELHRMTHSWTEVGATWNCANDANPSNGSADCSGATAWVMGSPDSLHPWVAAATAVQGIHNPSGSRNR